MGEWTGKMEEKKKGGRAGGRLERRKGRRKEYRRNGEMEDGRVDDEMEGGVGGRKKGIRRKERGRGTRGGLVSAAAVTK